MLKILLRRMRRLMMADILAELAALRAQLDEKNEQMNALAAQMEKTLLTIALQRRAEDQGAEEP